jgi:predicted metal-dependent hydrolase
VTSRRRRHAGLPAIREVVRFKTTVAGWAARIGVRPKRVQLQRMTTKWASCSSAGRLCFSWDLLRQAPAFREVVVVHELLHLLVPNHGKLFKSLLTAYVPSWQHALGRRDGVAPRCVERR